MKAFLMALAVTALVSAVPAFHIGVKLAKHFNMIELTMLPSLICVLVTALALGGWEEK